MYYAKHTKTGQIIVQASNEIDCIDKAVKATRNSFFVGSINWITAQTSKFEEFTKQQKLDFLEDNKIMVYQTDLPLQEPDFNL
jgi:hypothetical protein